MFSISMMFVVLFYWGKSPYRKSLRHWKLVTHGYLWERVGSVQSEKACLPCLPESNIAKMGLRPRTSTYEQGEKHKLDDIKREDYEASHFEEDTKSKRTLLKTWTNSLAPCSCRRGVKRIDTSIQKYEEKTRGSKLSNKKTLKPLFWTIKETCFTVWSSRKSTWTAVKTVRKPWSPLLPVQSKKLVVGMVFSTKRRTLVLLIGWFLAILGLS